MKILISVNETDGGRKNTSYDLKKWHISLKITNVMINPLNQAKFSD